MDNIDTIMLKQIKEIEQRDEGQIMAELAGEVLQDGHGSVQGLPRSAGGDVHDNLPDFQVSHGTRPMDSGSRLDLRFSRRRFLPTLSVVFYQRCNLRDIRFVVRF